MPLTLDDILAAPSDPEELNKHLIGRGLIPPIVAAPPPIAPATVGALSPVAPAIKPMTPPKTDWLARETGGIHPLRPEPTMDMSEAPELGGTPPGGAGAGIVKPMSPVAPTRKESIAAGKRQFQEMRPPLTADPGSAEFSHQKLAQIEFDKAHPWGGDISARPGLLGKIGHIAAKVGNIAGDVLAPGVMANIPGTDINKRIQEADTKRELATRTEAEQEGATKGLQQEETKTRLAKEQNEQNLEKDAQGNVVGWTDAQGKKHGLEEEETPQAIKDIAEASKSKSEGPRLEKTANGDIVQITTDEEGKATSNVVYKGDPKVETDLTTRTVGGQEHHILVDKKTGTDIKDLGAFKTEVKPPSLASELAKEKSGEEVVLAYDKDNKAHLMSKADAKEEGMTHVTKAASGDIDKAKTHHVVLNTLQTQLNSVVNASKALDQGIAQRGIIASALSHATDSTIDSMMRAAVMTGATEQTKDYVQSVIALREAGLALPKEITGGSRVSEVQASALWHTMPSAASLNSKYALKQAKKFQQDIDRLRERAPQVRGQAMVDPDDAIKGKGTEKQHTTNAPSGGATAAPAVGTVVDGHRFKGGDPSDKK